MFFKPRNIFAFTILLASIFVNTNGKISLSVPVLIPFTGTAKDGKTCQASMEVAIDAANNQPTFLPQYFVKPVFLDEGRSSAQAAKKSFSFIRSFKSTNNSIIAPIVVGPYFTPGCTAVASAIHHFNFHQVAIGCSSPSFTENRKEFPNIFRQRASSEQDLPVQLAFIKDIGKWQRIAIITNALNPFDYGMGIRLYKNAAPSNISIAWFGSVSAITSDVVSSMKKSEVRIIFIAVGSNQQFVMEFLCEAYHQDMRGSRYIFMSSSQAYVDPMALDEEPLHGCTKMMLTEQIQQFFWIGLVNNPLANHGDTPLGYDLDAFENRLDDKINGARTADYVNRHLCHDAMLGALIAFNNSDQQLKLDASGSLVDFEHQPKLVAKNVRNALATINYNGLRVGVISYSKRLERDDEPHFIEYWDWKSQTRKTIFITQTINGSMLITQNEELPWREFPRDGPKVKQIFLEIDQKLSIALIVITCVIFTFEAIGASIALAKQPTSGEMNEDIDVVVAKQARRFQIAKLVILIASALLTVSAVAFVVEKDDGIAWNCQIAPSLAALGIASVNGFLLSCVICASRDNCTVKSDFVRQSQMATSTSMFKTTQKSPWKMSTRPTTNSVVETLKLKPIIFGLLIYFVCNLVVVVIWMAKSAPQAKVIQLDKMDHFDQVHDSYTFYTTKECDNKQMWPIISMLLLNLLALLLICCVGYGIKRSHRRYSNDFKLEISRFVMAAINQITIICATVLIVIVVTLPTVIKVVLSVACNLLHMMSFILIFYRNLSQLKF